MCQKIYKYFSCQEHLDSFKTGTIRFGSLDYYRNIECPNRQDSHEGERFFSYNSDSVTMCVGGKKVPTVGPIEGASKTVNTKSFFIFSATYSSSQNKFGSFCAQVRSLDIFKTIVETALKKVLQSVSLRLGKVCYYDPNIFELQYSDDDPVLCKETRFCEEEEVRLYFSLDSFTLWANPQGGEYSYAIGAIGDSNSSIRLHFFNENFNFIELNIPEMVPLITLH